MSYLLVVIWMGFVWVSGIIVQEAILENWYDWASWYQWTRLVYYLSIIVILGLLIPRSISIKRKNILCLLWGLYGFSAMIINYMGDYILLLLAILGMLILDKPTK